MPIFAARSTHFALRPARALRMAQTTAQRDCIHDGELAAQSANNLNGDLEAAHFVRGVTTLAESDLEIDRLRRNKCSLTSMDMNECFISTT